VTDDAREQAIKRLHDKKAFWSSVVGYAVACLVCVFVWALGDPRGYFWPIWIIGFGALGLAGHAWSVYGQRPITEDDIDREMKRGGA